MSEHGTIVCKPTPWFLSRGLLVFLMFGVFAVLFYRDGSTGYRRANEVYYQHQTFRRAVAEFQGMNSSSGDGAGALTPEAWREYAGRQVVDFPKDGAVLPVGLKLPMPWPRILQDFEKVKSMNVNKLWAEYSAEKELPLEPVEHAYGPGKILEQWVAFWVCLALSSGAAFFTLRTMRRSITANERGILTQTGRFVEYADMKTLDLRKWESKGLAFLDYSGASGTGRIRLDGLTYGGFNKEQGEPAEMLMQLLRSRFSGELIEYVTVGEVERTGDATAVD